MKSKYFKTIDKILLLYPYHIWCYSNRIWYIDRKCDNTGNKYHYYIPIIYDVIIIEYGTFTKNLIRVINITIKVIFYKHYYIIAYLFSCNIHAFKILDP